MSENYKPHTYEIDELEKLTARISEMKPLPKAASPEALEFGHGKWMEYHRQIKFLQLDAMQIALLALPPEVARAYKKACQQIERLLNMGNSGEEITHE